MSWVRQPLSKAELDQILCKGFAALIATIKEPKNKKKDLLLDKNK